MAKVLCILGMVVALGILVVYGLDLAMGIPFEGKNVVFDVAFLLAAVTLGYLSWSTFREQI